MVASCACCVNDCWLHLSMCAGIAFVCRSNVLSVNVHCYYMCYCGFIMHGTKVSKQVIWEQRGPYHNRYPLFPGISWPLICRNELSWEYRRRSELSEVLYAIMPSLIMTTLPVGEDNEWRHAFGYYPSFWFIQHTHSYKPPTPPPPPLPSPLASPSHNDLITS